MFCSKCGNQLPDGAAFCASCGNPVNAQPATPVETVNPVEPIVSAEPVNPVEPIVSAEPVMPAEPVVPAEPVMPAEPVVPVEPVMPAEPVMPQPTFMPMDSSMPASPVVSQTPIKPKKSKAPLIVGLSIAALLIVIGVIIAIIFLGGDDKDKDKDNNKTTTVAGEEKTSGEEKTTEEESTEEESTEEPTTSSGSVDVDEDEAMDVVEEFLDSLSAEEYTDAADYMLPALMELYQDVYTTTPEELLALIATSFYGSDMKFLGYDAVDTMEGDADYFFEECVEDLEDYDSYIEPDAFIDVEIEFTYNNESAYGYAYLAVCGDEYYIYEFDLEDVDFEEPSEDPSGEDPTGDVPQFPTVDYSDVADLFDGAAYSIGGDVEGTRFVQDGYGITRPDDWSTNNNIHMAPDQTTNINIVVDDSLATLGRRSYYELNLGALEDMGCTILEKGQLFTDYLNGLYVEYDYDMGGTVLRGKQFYFEKDGTNYIITITTSDPDSSSYEDGLYAASTFYYED